MAKRLNNFSTIGELMEALTMYLKGAAAAVADNRSARGSEAERRMADFAERQLRSVADDMESARREDHDKVRLNLQYTPECSPPSIDDARALSATSSADKVVGSLIDHARSWSAAFGEIEREAQTGDSPEILRGVRGRLDQWGRHMSSARNQMVDA